MSKEGILCVATGRFVLAKAWIHATYLVRLQLNLTGVDDSLPPRCEPVLRGFLIAA